MSRIRSIHPGLWTDERFVSVSPLARLFFVGIWNECDDKGLFEWSPLKLKMRVLPADNCDADELLAEIEAAGSVRRYEIDGKSYGAVRNFNRFQRPKKPNDIHPETDEIAMFCGREGEKKGGEQDEVPEEFGTSGEKSPQMEEEGGRREGSKQDSLSKTAARTDDIADPDLRRIMEIVQPVSPFPDVRVLMDWKRDGISIANIAIPAIERLTARQRDVGESIGRLKYFDAAVREDWREDEKLGAHLRAVAGGE